MHFSKTYAQLLLDLPPDLRDNAVQYRQLKKVINQIVGELSGLGLKPALLHELIETSEGPSTPPESKPSTPPHERADDEADTHTGAPDLTTLHLDDGDEHKSLRLGPQTRVVYELNAASGKIEPQLRISIGVPFAQPTPTEDIAVQEEGKDGEVDADAEEHVDAEEGPDGHTRLLWAFQKMQFEDQGDAGGVIGEVDESFKSGSPQTSLPFSPSIPDSIYSPEVTAELSSSPATGAAAAGAGAGVGAGEGGQTREIVIPLVHDSEFYNLLSNTLESIAVQLATIHADFVRSLHQLSRAISDTAQPASVAAHFHPTSSVTTHAGAVRVRTGQLKSDLYAWREIFQIYLEAEVFESVGERTRGERSIEECERRLQQFADRVTTNGLGDRRQFKLKQSIQALETFLSLNLFILNIKKFSHANSEATRKILKKHTKRTALFFPGLAPGTLPPSSAPPPLLALAARTHPFSLPRLLVQALGETLLPIVPSVEDYACLICMSLAFKPIRLQCGHLFCVRCLVKMQKRKNEHCPMCRSPSVLVANRTNVDWALLNFMQDWFPVEAKEKLKANEREASEEELRELGIDPNQPCVIM